MTSFQELCPHIIDDASVTHHIEELQAGDSRIEQYAQEILGRYNQIVQLPPAQHGLTKYQILQLAYFVTIDLLRDGAQAVYFKKNQLALPRSIAISKERGEIFLLSKRKVAILNGRGKSKKVTSCVCLPLLQSGEPAHLVAQSVFKKPGDGKREIRIHQALNGLPGIWPIRAWFIYKKSGEIDALSTITPFGTFLLEYARKEKALSFQELCKTAFSLIQGVHSMHKNRYFHGDLKLENALKNGDMIGLIDFGSTFHVDLEQNPRRKDCYGTAGYTSPEAFGDTNFQGDLFKTDIWALGIMLYQLRFCHIIPWIGVVNNTIHLSSNEVYSKRLEESKHGLKNDVQYTVENVLAQLEGIQQPTKIEAFDKLIYKMLRYDPQVRIDIVTAVVEIQKIMEMPDQ